MSKALAWWPRLHSIIHGDNSSSKGNSTHDHGDDNDSDCDGGVASGADSLEALQLAEIDALSAAKGKGDVRVNYDNADGTSTAAAATARAPSLEFEIAWPSKGLTAVPAWLWLGVIDKKYATRSTGICTDDDDQVSDTHMCTVHIHSSTKCGECVMII